MSDHGVRETWDDLNQAAPCGHVFASAAYLDLIGRTFRGVVEETALQDSGTTSATTRLLSRRSPFALRAVVPPFTPYSAILLDKMPSEAQTHERTSNLEHLLAALENRYAGADISLPPSIVDVRTFSWRKWAVRPLYTYRIDLDHESAIWTNWSESARRIVRRAREHFEIVDPGPNVVANLSVESYKRSGRKPPLSETGLTTFIADAESSVAARLFGARNTESGIVESAVAILRNDSTAYYWIAGGAAGPGMSVLLAELFEQLSGEGIRTFDFVGANTDSIAEFKRRFGGHLTTYFRAVLRRGPLIVAEDAIHSLR
jgi:hypothetical protein